MLKSTQLSGQGLSRRKNNRVSGTPIEAVVSNLSDTQKAEFNALHIFTIDQFAQLADSVGNKIMGFNDLRDKARTFILAAKDSQIDGKRAETMKKSCRLRLLKLHNCVR
jgi:hypothetical protein